MLYTPFVAGPLGPVGLTLGDHEKIALVPLVFTSEAAPPIDASDGKFVKVRVLGGRSVSSTEIVMPNVSVRKTEYANMFGGDVIIGAEFTSLTTMVTVSVALRRGSVNAS